MLSSSDDSSRPLGERLSDGLSRVVRGLFWLGLAIAAWVVLSRYTRSIEMPNGAVLAYRPDLTYEARIDLFRPKGFRPVIRAVDRICYNDKAVWVTTLDYKSYVWPSLEAEPVEIDAKTFNQVLAQTGLATRDHSCNGYYQRFRDAGILVDRVCSVIPDPNWKKQRFAESMGDLCDPTTHSSAPAQVEANAKP
jgi:hypothetical protein